jgi:hypothetical protein
VNVDFPDYQARKYGRPLDPDGRASMCGGGGRANVMDSVALDELVRGYIDEVNDGQMLVPDELGV